MTVRIEEGSPCIAIEFIAPNSDAMAPLRQEMAYPIEITMPCGSQVIYESNSDMPLNDVPCACGDATHWFLRFRIRNG